MIFIGTARRFLFIKGTHKLNAWVRDVTAKLEGIVFSSIKNSK